jgi:hypothetical protein
MPEWLVIVLLLIFVIHLVVFGRLAVNRKLPYYWLVTAVFAVLSISFGLRLFTPQLTLGPLAAYQLFRYFAWLLAAITIPWLVIRLLNKRNH